MAALDVHVTLHTIKIQTDDSGIFKKKLQKRSIFPYYNYFNKEKGYKNLTSSIIVESYKKNINSPSKKQKLVMSPLSYKYKFPSLPKIDYNFSENNRNNHDILHGKKIYIRNKKKTPVMYNNLILDKSKINIPKYTRKFPSFNLEEYLTHSPSRRNIHFISSSNVSKNESFSDTYCNKIFKDINDELDISKSKNKFRMQNIFEKDKIKDMEIINKNNKFENDKSNSIHVSKRVSKMIEGFMKNSHKYHMPKLCPVSPLDYAGFVSSK